MLRLSRVRGVHISSAKYISSCKFTDNLLHESFSLLDDKSVDCYGIRALKYVHKKTGAEVLSVIAPEDKNKVFGISFKTPVDDSTGIPHILEHSVLCGSRKYPVKEPFVDMLKGSLNTYLNAFTYPDRTCYPVASMNTKDFYNLMDVYMDAVFFPRALNDPMVLKQEGWHYEFDGQESDAEILTKPLIYKGVVYNEMKGVYSSPDSLHYKLIQQSLFPNTSYKHDSGGDPVAIPDLSMKSFVDFHAKYYHPSNAKIYFYGDDCPHDRLVKLEEYLGLFDKRNSTKILPQKLLQQPVYVSGSYSAASDSLEGRHMLSMNWVLNDAAFSNFEVLTLNILNHLLLGTTSSVLYKALLPHGESVIGGGISDDLVQSTFSVGLKGVMVSDADKESGVTIADKLKRVESVILETLEAVATNGFDSETMNASVNIIEFHLREFNTGGYPRGLAFMLSVLPGWIYSDSFGNNLLRNPIDAIVFEEQLKMLKEDIAVNGSAIFQNAVRKYLLQNQHRAIVNQFPSNTMEKEEAERELSKLELIKRNMSSSELEIVRNEWLALKEAQLQEDSEEAKSCIPKLTLNDIDRSEEKLPISIDRIQSNGLNVTVLTHEMNSTNGVLYADIVFDYSDVLQEDLALLPFYSRMLLESGTMKLSERQLQNLINTNTGGIQASFMSELKHNERGVSNSNDVNLHFVVRAKVLNDKIPQLFQILNDILLNANFANKNRFLEIVRETKSVKEDRVKSSGNSYALMTLASKISYLGFLKEQTSGLSFINGLGDLLKLCDSDWSAVQRKLLRIHERVVFQSVAKSGCVINLTGGHGMFESTTNAVTQMLCDIQSKGTCSSKDVDGAVLKYWPKQQRNVDNSRVNGFSIPSQVNYVVKGGQLLSANEDMSVRLGSFAVVAKYLSTSYLWDNIRVVGGAYGSSCGFGASSGRIAFSSYRDPNVIESINIYDKAAQHIEEQVASGALSQDVIQQYVIGCIGDLDSPLSPDQKGFTSLSEYLRGESHEEKQKYRNEVISTNVEDFKVFAAKLRALMNSSDAVTVVVGPEDALEKANQQLIKSGYPSLQVKPALSVDK